MLSLSSLVQAGETLKPPQYWFSYAVAFAGLVLQAAIIGGVTNLFDNLDERANEKRKQLEELERWMAYERVPHRLQNRVREFHEYLLECGHTRNTERHLDALPVSLRLNIDLCLKRHLVDALPLFRACTSVEIITILKQVVSRITMPAEIITRAAAPTNEMYFVSRGMVAVLARTAENGQAYDPSAAKKVVSTLAVGAFFGELALLHASLAHRCETTQSLGYGECYVLTKAKFDDLVRRSTGFAYVIRTVARERLERAMFLEASRRKALDNRDKRRGPGRPSMGSMGDRRGGAAADGDGKKTPGASPTQQQNVRRTLGDKETKDHVINQQVHRASQNRRGSVIDPRRATMAIRSVAATVRRRLSLEGSNSSFRTVASAPPAPSISVYDIVEADLVDVESGFAQKRAENIKEKEGGDSPQKRGSVDAGGKAPPGQARRSMARKQSNQSGPPGRGRLIRQASKQFNHLGLGPGGRQKRSSANAPSPR